MTCPVCRGTERITLPVYEPLPIQTRFEPAQPSIVRQADRSYPCPECRKDGYVPIDRIWVEEDYCQYMAEYEREPGFMDHVKRRLVNNLAHFIFDKTASVAFHEGP